MKEYKGHSQSLSLAAVVFFCLLFTGSFVFAQDSGPVEPAALKVIGLRDIVEQDPNLTGLGIRIAAVCRSMTYLDDVPQGDHRISTNHSSLFGADVIFEDGSDGKSGVSSHSTAIGGILLGLDPYGTNSQTGPFCYIGACPDAKLEVFEFWRFVSLYVFAERHFDADIITLSLGEIFPDWWTRGLERLSAEKGSVVFAAAGNGKRVCDPVLYPAAGANIIAVGVVNAASEPNNQKSLVLFSPPDPNESSAGPTVDGRCKPDIVALGRCVVPAGESENGYIVEGDWSSLATPIAAGASALLLQKARSEPDLAMPMFTGNTNSVIKALLLTSADKLPFWHKGQPGNQDDIFSPLDYSQGAGALNIQAAYKLLTAGWQVSGEVESGGWDNNVLEADTPVIYEFHLPEPAGQYISVTLCWNRIYSSVFPYKPEYDKDSDLQLELWGVDPNEPQRNILLDFSDSIHDNVEHIYFAADANYTDYQLVVRQSTPQPEKQSYAIAWMTRPDTSADNPFWYDLNNDGTVNMIDELIYFVLEQNQSDLLEGITDLNLQIKLSSSRLQMLKSEWPAWRKHLSKWNIASSS